MYGRWFELHPPIITVQCINKFNMLRSRYIVERSATVRCLHRQQPMHPHTFASDTPGICWIRTSLVNSDPISHCNSKIDDAKGSTMYCSRSISIPNFGSGDADILLQAYHCKPLRPVHPESPPNESARNRLNSYRRYGQCSALSLSDPIHPESMPPTADRWSNRDLVKLSSKLRNELDKYTNY